MVVELQMTKNFLISDSQAVVISVSVYKSLSNRLTKIISV